MHTGNARSTRLLAGTIGPYLHLVARMRPRTPEERPVTGEPSHLVKARVERAHAAQTQRWGTANGHVDEARLRSEGQVTTPAMRLLDAGTQRWNLTAAESLITIRIARTVADLEQAPGVEITHIAEAFAFVHSAAPREGPSTNGTSRPHG